METVRDALTRNTVGQISIARLARLVEAPPTRLHALVEQGYLRIVIHNNDFDQIIVARPGERRIQWLKNMFQPLVMKPIIPLKEAADLFGLTEGYAAKYCFYFLIPMQSDQAFGNLIPFKSLKRLARAAWAYRRIDRAGLLRYFLSQIEGVRWKEPPPYSVRLEKEIERIRTLPEPMRTERSIALILAFRDARKVTECLHRQKEILGELAKSERQILDLFKRITGLEATWGDGSQEEKNRTEGPVAI